MMYYDAIKFVIATLEAVPPFTAVPYGGNPLTVKFLPYYPRGDEVETPTVAFSQAGGNTVGAGLGGYDMRHLPNVQLDVLADDQGMATQLMADVWAGLLYDLNHTGGTGGATPGKGYLEINGVHAVLLTGEPRQEEWDAAGRVARLLAMLRFRFED